MSNFSTSFEQSELLLVGTNQTLSAVDRSSFDRDTVRRSIRRQYLYVNQDILKARSNSHRTRRRQLNSDNAILDEVRPLSAPLARSPPDAQPNRNSSTERSSATYLGSLLQNLFDSDQATHSNNSNTFEPECSNNDEQQIALISSSDSLASAGNISSVSGETTFSATSSFENFQHTATSTDRDRSTAEPIEPANLSQQPVDQATADDLSTLDKQTEQVNINQREVKGDEFSNATTLPRRFLVVDSLDQLTSTISNLSLIESDVIVDPMQNGAVDDEETNEHEECEEDEGGDNTLNSISAENQLNVQNRSIRTSRTGHEVIFGGSRRRHKSPSTRQSRKALRKRYKKFLLVFLTPF